MKKIRYFKLKNKGLFVTRIVVNYEHDDGKGNSSKGTYECSGYRDICKYAERTLDLTDTSIPNGAVVQLKAEVVWGKDREAGEKYIFDKDAGAMATYRTEGTTRKSKLKFIEAK